jgi:hypothetical protein
VANVIGVVALAVSALVPLWTARAVLTIMLTVMTQTDLYRSRRESLNSPV